YALRRDLHTHELFRGATELRLNQDVLASDVQAFEDALQRSDVEAAVRAYAGPFLDGFFIAKAPEFERWVEAERARLKQRACWATERPATAAAARGEHEAAVTWWRHVSALDPLNARIARALMGALAAAGDRAGALRHARIHESLLRQELDAAPDAAVTDFARRLREVSEQRARTVAAGEVTRERVVPDARLPEAPTRSGAATRALRRAFRVASWPAVVAALTAVVGGVLYSRFKKVAALDPDLLAVAPFDVLAPNAELWREGLVDVMSRNLDGAGPLRTVTPTVVIRGWQGRADAASAKSLAGRAGACRSPFAGTTPGPPPPATFFSELPLSTTDWVPATACWSPSIQRQLDRSLQCWNGPCAAIPRIPKSGISSGKPGSIPRGVV